MTCDISILQLGQLYFALQHNNWFIGYVESVDDNVTIHLGENTIKFFGELQSTCPESHNALVSVIQNFLTGHKSQVEAVAGPNATSCALLAVGMIGLSLNILMPPYNERLIVSLIFNAMSLMPSITKKKVTLSASITIKINSPLGQKSPLNIQTMDMSVLLLYQNHSVGTLNISQATVKQLDAVTYAAQFANKYLTLTGTGTTYKKFTRDFISANRKHPVEFCIAGTASINGSFALGSLNINGIFVENNVSLVGLDSFSNICVNGISVDGEEGDALRISINATIDNPGTTEVRLRNFSLLMAEGENNTILGHVPIDFLTIQSGSNAVTLDGLV